MNRRQRRAQQSKTRHQDSGDTASYKNGKVTLLKASDIKAPSYDILLDWLNAMTKGRATSFDIWARGNYTRRIIDLRKQGCRPFIIPVKYVDEMRWAYRRLALLGQPIDFVYRGAITPSKVLTLFPADVPIDAGWGYISALGSRAPINGREYFPVMGNGCYMPDTIVDWLVEEAGMDFRRGRVFVAPSKLIGVSTLVRGWGYRELADILGGSRVISGEERGVKAFLEIDLPYIDGMNVSDFQSFLRDHEEDLSTFHRHFHRLVSAHPDSDDGLQSIIKELREEADALDRAAKFTPMRGIVRKLGGIWGRSSLIFDLAAALMGNLFGLVRPITDAAITLAGAWAECDAQAALRRSAFYIPWKLGMAKGAGYRKAPISTKPKLSMEPSASACHWMCPPTPGMLHLAARKVEEEGSEEREQPAGIETLLLAAEKIDGDAGLAAAVRRAAHASQLPSERT